MAFFRDSQKRLYSIGEYERSVYIDPRREQGPAVRKDGPPPKAEGNAVMYEVAAVGPKLANVNRVGGERSATVCVLCCLY